MFGLRVRVSSFFFFFLNSTYCNVHGTLTVQISMWTVILKVNSNKKNDFFIIFSFQQNKQYPSEHIINQIYVLISPLYYYYYCGGTNLYFRRYYPFWEWAKEANATRMDLLNLTSRRDASHPQLINAFLWRDEPLP